jgi:hypothetical protein
MVATAKTTSKSKAKRAVKRGPQWLRLSEVIRLLNLVRSTFHEHWRHRLPAESIVTDESRQVWVHVPTLVDLIVDRKSRAAVKRARLNFEMSASPVIVKNLERKRAIEADLLALKLQFEKGEVVSTRQVFEIFGAFGESIGRAAESIGRGHVAGKDAHDLIHSIIANTVRRIEQRFGANPVDTTCQASSGETDLEPNNQQPTTAAAESKGEH